MLLTVVLFLLAVSLIPRWQVPSDSGLTPKDRFDIENDARVTVAQIGGGLALLVALYFTWRRVGAAEKGVRLAEQGQITERFTRAIEQLGSSELAIRLGGIYALERIARDSERDHWPIMEVLTSFVRQKAPWSEEAAMYEDENTPLPSTRADVQAVLTVIGRRERSAARESGRVLDLRWCDLRGADLTGAHLEGASLESAHLEWAYLGEAHLRGANLYGAELARTHLEGADLSHANLLGDPGMEGAERSAAIALAKRQLAIAITDDSTLLPEDIEWLRTIV